MSESPNKFIKFWQELKRRKVFGVVTTYAATAYIILEVINNLAFPLNLPSWIATLVLAILVIGLPIVIILAWIFDFTPKGIEKTESLGESESKEIVTKPVKSKTRASYLLNAILIIAVLILAYPKIFKRNALENLRSSGERISIAVMPFHNMTNDTLWNIYQEGIQENICAYLSNFSDALKIRQAESTNKIIQNNGFLNYSSITPTIAGHISAKLEAEIFVYGSIIKAGSMIRVNAQLMDTKTKESFKSFQVEGSSEENIIQLIDSLSAQIKNFLLITRLKKGPNIYLQHYETAASSPEAFRYAVLGNSAFFKLDYTTAREMYSQALAIDSNLYMAAMRLVFAYWNPGLINEAKELCLRIYGRKERMTDFQKTFSEVVYAALFLTPNEALKFVNQLLDIDDELPQAYYMLGYLYDALQKYDKVIPPLEKSLEIFDRWNVKPMWIANYYYLGVAYHKTGQYRKEKRLYMKAEQDFPDDFDIISMQATLSLTEGDTVSANDYIGKLTAIAKELSFPEVNLATIMASLFSNAGILNKEEEYYRKALSLEPENGWILNNLAYFLIDKDRNVNEGMELVEKALKSEPENFYFLACKGWGLYKQGKNREAFEFLNKSWELKPVYDHTTYLHLEEVKKVVASQKSN